jgi:hypothetical protein
MEMYGAEGAEGGYGGGPGMGEEAMAGGMDMEMMYGAGGMGMEMGGMYGAKAAEIPTDPRIIWSRRRLKYQLTCVKRGLDGMAIAGKESQHEKAVDQVAKAVEEALALTDPPEDKPDLEGLAESIRKGVRGLAFLAPEVAEIGLEPVESPAVELPAGAATALSDPAAAAAPPKAPGATAADPTAPPAGDPGSLDQPPGLE